MSSSHQRGFHLVGALYSVKSPKVSQILQVPQKVSGDVSHHCDQILTYTSGVILGWGGALKKKKRCRTRKARRNSATITTQIQPRPSINTNEKTHFQHSDRDNLVFCIGQRLQLEVSEVMVVITGFFRKLEWVQMLSMCNNSSG